MPYVNNQDALLKFVLSQPNIAEQVVRQYSGAMYNASSPMEPIQQIVQQPQVQYVTQPLPYHQQRQQPQMQFQQPQPQNIQPVYHSQQQPQTFQPMYHQQQPTQIYQTVPMQFQPSVPQQQPQTYFQQPQQQQQQPQPYFQPPQQQILYQNPQRSQSPSVIHYLPANGNQPLLVPQQNPRFQTNTNDNMPQQVLEQMNGWSLSNGTQLTTNSIQPQTTTTTDQVETHLHISSVN